MRCRTRTLGTLILAASIGLLSGRTALAQKATFDIEGVVTDAQKAVLLRHHNGAQRSNRPCANGHHR